MGSGPSKDMVGPPALNSYYKKAMKIAPFKGFHWQQMGHMKPSCPLQQHRAQQTDQAVKSQKKEDETLQQEVATILGENRG